MPKGILNKASLVMVPEAPIDGTMPSVFPEDRSGDFTFTRGSNLAATRVASNGLIEKGRENILLQSNQFDTTWANNSSSETSGQADKDGGTDAWLLNSTGSFGSITQSFTAISGVSTLSIYAKAGTNNWLLLRMNATTNARAWFDLENGVLGSTDGPTIESKIEEIGTDGWYRCSITGNTSSFSQVLIYPTNANLVVGAAGSIYIQDAQVEVGLAATSYIESGATTGKAGLLENEPRIDFTGGGCGSLLLEPSRTNLVTNSEYFENYTKTDSSVMSNGATSPEGLENASKLFDGTGSAQHYIGNVGIGFFTNTDIRGTSVFVKAGTLDYMQLRITNLTGNFSYYYVNVNLNDGSVASIASGGTTNLSNSVEDYGNGWYRVSMACSFTNSNVTGSRTEIYTAKNNNHTYTGTGTDYILIYGAQSEAGSYPTSYIPTHGNIVTRSDDEGNLNLLVSKNIIQSDTLTYFIELNTESLVRDSSLRIINLGSANNEFFIYNNSLSESRPILYISSSTGQSTYLLPQDNLKLCIRIQPSGTQVFVNGSQVLNTTNAPEFSANSYYSFRGTNRKALFKQKAFFPTALTDEECSALTQP